MAALEGGTVDAAEEDIALTEEVLSSLSPEQLMAIVKNKIIKKLEGQGKGLRKCYECSSGDCIAVNCLASAARVAAEGDDVTMGDNKGKGKRKNRGGGKGKAKGKGCPRKTAEKNDYPGAIPQPKPMPTPSQ